jgi:hypothetical protein
MGLHQKRCRNPFCPGNERGYCKIGAIAATVKVTPAFQAYKSGIFDEHARFQGQMMSIMQLQ